jgi:hypothetical protein
VVHGVLQEISAELLLFSNHIFNNLLVFTHVLLLKKCSSFLDQLCLLFSETCFCVLLNDKEYIFIVGKS